MQEKHYSYEKESIKSTVEKLLTNIYGIYTEVSIEKLLTNIYRIYTEVSSNFITIIKSTKISPIIQYVHQAVSRSTQQQSLVPISDLCNYVQYQYVLWAARNCR